MIGNSNSALQIENLKSENIKKHVTILGVTGTYSSLPDAVDSGVFWTNPDDDGYWQDCEYVNYPYENPLSLNNQTNKASRVKRIKFTNCNDMSSVQDRWAQGNAYLEEVDFLDTGILTIGGYAIAGACKKVILPKGLQIIGAYCFQSSMISTIKFPASLKTIGNTAFWRCYSLGIVDCTELTYTGTVPNTQLTNSSAFLEATNVILKFADEATMNVYAQATNWSTYASRMTYEGAE